MHARQPRPTHSLAQRLTLPELPFGLLSMAIDVGVKCTAPFACVGLQGFIHLKQT